MYKRVLTSAALGLCLFGTPAFAGSGGETGYDLYRNCAARTDMQEMACYSYLLGVWDGVVAGRTDTKEGSLFCGTPEAGQMAMVYLRFAKQTPKSLHLPAGVVAAASFIDAFPCAGE